MSRRTVLVGMLLATAALWLLLPSGQALSQALHEVFVTNFPDVQTVDGAVAVTGPVHLSQLQSFRNLVVPPVSRDETTRLVDAGVLQTDGFPSVVLSLHGVVRGDVKQPGDVGAILIPVEQTVQEAFNELGAMHFYLETVASGITSRTPYFASNQPLYTVAFPRYRVLLYNTTDKTVTANLFAYLTNGVR